MPERAESANEVRVKGVLMADYQMRLVGREEIARSTMAFWFDPNGVKYEFRAGQHADFSFLNPRDGDKGGDNERTFSLASSPQETGPIMVAMRMRETGFKTALNATPAGTLFKVSGPRGSFSLHKDFARPAVFLAGGIGITPIRSILHSAVSDGLPHQLYLFYSNREPGDAAFLPELEEWAARNRSFVLVPTITKGANPAGRYQTGYIDHALLAKHLEGFNGPVYYVAGPSGMVVAMLDVLRRAGVSEDDIKTEEFGDYRFDLPGTP
jgi:ferredoxin-NADP reductase